ncbi:MAG TPA: efflux RND transporter permease subunit [Acidobacteriota bacterium]|nr:efflux RND transporter permease subunit [Acidobacteriota bacterium]
MSGLNQTENPAVLQPGPSHWTVRQAKPIIFVIIALVIAGIYLASAIPISVFPSTDFPRIVIGVDNGVAPIEQMLVSVTKRIEDAVNSVPGLEKVNSITSRGSAEVSLFFSWKVDMFQTLELVNAAVARVQSSLPATAVIRTDRMTFASFPIMGYSLTSSTVPQTRLWELATYELKPRLNRLNGVATVVVQGGEEPEFEVQPDPAKLIQTSTTIPNILDAIKNSNMIDSPGLLEYNHQLVLGLVSGQTINADQISKIVVKNTPSNEPIRIGDLGIVRPSVKPVYTVVTANRKPAVLLSIYRQPDGNTVQVADLAHAEIERMRGALPKGVQLEPFYDQSEIIKDSITSVRDAILIGLILASLIMVLFLRDWGTSLVAGLVIPATLAITLIFLRIIGETFNLMTLGGLAAAVGLVIDDAIVVVENIVAHRDSGQGRAEAIRLALKEIRVPLIGSTITPIVVFLPLITMAGVNGVFFRALAITVGVALLTSLALAMSWTPTLSHIFLRRQRKPRAGSPQESKTENGRLMKRLVESYGYLLGVVLKHPILLAAGSLLLVAATYFGYQALGSDVLPAMDEGGFIVDYIMPAGTSLTETNRVLNKVESIIRSTPEVGSTSRRTGLQLGLAAVTEANTGDFTVKLKSNRKRGSDEIMAEMRDKIREAAPQLDVEFVQLLQDMIGDLSNQPEAIVIKLFSEDPELLQRWAPAIGENIEKIHGIVDVKNGIENTISGPALTFRVDPATVARAGFTASEAELDASAVLQGEPAENPVVVNDRAYNIRVRFPASTRSSLEAIRKTLLVSSTGKTATLDTLASIETNPGQTEIIRENLQRYAMVTANLENLDLGSGIAAVKECLKGMKLPPEIRVTFGGKYEEQQKSFHDLAVVLILAVLLVFMVLLFEFRNFGAPLAILASALLSTFGVIMALLVTHTTFNISSFMGLIMVIGIVAKNGILLLDANQKFRSMGYGAEEAMILAGERRIRPILMTALATVAGMIPLALAWGAGSQMLQPLAIGVIGGIFASMFLSLIVTPAVEYFISQRGAMRENA